MRVCVFCGSSNGNNRIYSEAARELGETLAARAIELVYGGGRVGLMGVVADAILKAGGVAIGIIPQRLVQSEIHHTGLTACHVVATMHERKTKMSELADAFIALPGGLGTLEEILEQWTWAQLGIHRKPCGFLNTNAYFSPVQEMVERMVGHGFLDLKYASMTVFDSNPDALIEAFRGYSPPPPKWQGSVAAAPLQTIRIVAALIQDRDGRVLLVRKKGTKAFMQPGGKLLDSESDFAALERELGEELMCSIRPQSAAFLGRFSAPAANESGCTVDAALYRVECVGSVKAGAEIDEILWLDLEGKPKIDVAPLTEIVLPLAKMRKAAKPRE
jgi:hypothetical protein